MNESIIVHT